ncbi:MAG: hypothetical protein AAF789_02315 [Bacteroidota bacterium]
MPDKPRILKAYEKLDVSMLEKIKLAYPEGFKDHLIQFPNKEGGFHSGLPFETDDKYYLIKMTASEAKEIIEEDDDYDMDGNLKDSIREEYEEKYDEDD